MKRTQWNKFICVRHAVQSMDIWKAYNTINFLRKMFDYRRLHFNANQNKWNTQRMVRRRKNSNTTRYINNDVTEVIKVVREIVTVAMYALIATCDFK